MIDRAKFFKTVRASFGKLKQSQVNGFNQLLDVWELSKWTDLRWLSYALATTWHESACTMQPIEEFGRGVGQPYGQPAGPYNKVYYGRGYVQITWYENYRLVSNRMVALGAKNVDLVQFPEQALQPSIASFILYAGMEEGWFTGKKFTDYFTPTKTDAFNARRIVNALDKAAVIRGYFDMFLVAVGYTGKTSRRRKGKRT